MYIDLSYKTRFILLFFSAIFVTWIIYSQPISYGANDNVGILRSIELGLDVPFISYLLQKLLAVLYQHVHADVPWYSLFLYLTHITSISLFLMAIFSIKAIHKFIVPITIVYLIIYASFILRVGYNNASIMIGANSLLYFLVAFQSSKSLSTKTCIILGSLLSLSFLIRTSAFQAVIVFTAPVILLVIKKSINRRGIRCFLLFFFVPIVVIASNALVKNYAITEAYQQYMVFNKIRGTLHGFPVLSINENNDDLLKENGWSKADYKALQSWLFFNESKFNIVTLSNVLKYPAESSDLWHSSKEKVFDFLSDYIHMIVIFLIPLLVVFSRDIPKKAAIPIFAYQVYVLSGAVYMLVEYRFPVRIGIPIFLSCITMLFFLLMTNLNSKVTTDVKCYTQNEYRWSFWFIVLILAISIWNLVLYLEVRAKTQDGITKFDKVISIVHSLPDSAFILTGGGALRYQYMNPLTVYNKASDKKFISAGWPIFSPIFYFKLGQIGIKEGNELFALMLDNENAYYIAGSEQVLVFSESAKEELGEGVCLEAVVQLPGKIAIYQLKRESKCYSDLPVRLIATEFGYRQTGRFFKDFDGTGEAIRVRKGEKGIIFSGPVLDLPAGFYTVVFDIFTENNLSEPVRIDLVGYQDVKKSRILSTKSMVPSENGLEVKFHLKKREKNVKIQVRSLGTERIVFRGISVEKCKNLLCE